ncbi:hypothetical protein ARAM_000363 [Aspergillus rambellii]|uniref:F-box domain-containing protein n=1 Tax=Aspergillus rambellii TaxID=308745 RepID=A0A0F8VU47_9EURO|nr:hypothetical protein ARAM_000363 [Aspergillus rambellii]
MISSIRKLVCCARKPRSPACSVKLQPQHIGEASTRASDAPPCPMLNDVPLEILQLIFPLIPFLSQVCLALTCKPLYRLLGHVLKDDRLAWPRALAMKTYEVPLNQPDHLRNQLLLLLEDDRWLYCSWCLKLHPHALFLRLDCGKDSPPSLHRTCIHSAGVVDLCPCLSLTFFDRIRLEEWLQTGLADTITRSPRVHQAFQLSVLDGQRYLLHQCSITDHKYAFVRIFMKIILDEDGLLVVRTRYYVRMCMNTPQPDPRILTSSHLYGIQGSGQAIPVMFARQLHTSLVAQMMEDMFFSVHGV